MNLKRYIAVLAVAVMLLAVLCGCGTDANGNDPESTGNETQGSSDGVKYSATVVDQHGNGIAGLALMFTGTEPGQLYMVQTGLDGSCAVSSETPVTVTITSIPDGYTSAKTEFAYDGTTEMTIVLIAEEDASVAYTVTVVDQNGDAVENVTLQFCDDENCKMPVVTDSTGIVTVSYEESEYHVTLTALPDGYASEVTEFYFDSGATEMTIVLTAEEAGE